MDGEQKNLKVGAWSVTVGGIQDIKGFAELCCVESKNSDPRFEVIKSSVSTRVFRFKWYDKTYYYKEFCFNNKLKQLRMLKRGTHLHHIASELRRFGFDTPAIVCRARKGTQVFVVSDEANADESVYNVLMDKLDMSLPNLQRFRYKLGNEIGRLHTAGFVHGDLRWGNVLVRDVNADQPVFVYIDNDRTRKYKQLPDQERIKNLVQLKYPGSLLDKPESDWDAMWEGYVSGNPEVRAKEESWRRKVDEKNRKRVEAWWKKPRNKQLLEQRNQANGTANEI